jgi:hypothetical protein
MIEFTDKDIEAISSAVCSKLRDLESVYKRNVNSRPDYAQYIAECMVKYVRVFERIYPGSQFVTDSQSLYKYLYGSFNVEVLDG